MGGEDGRRRWERDEKGGGSVLLYLTRAGSMARAGAVVSEWRCLPGEGGGRTAVIVACHAGGM